MPTSSRQNALIFTEILGEFERAIGSMWASTPTNLPEGVEHPENCIKITGSAVLAVEPVF